VSDPQNDFWMCGCRYEDIVDAGWAAKVLIYVEGLRAHRADGSCCDTSCCPDCGSRRPA
jgi:hypothetical protein